MVLAGTPAGDESKDKQNYDLSKGLPHSVHHIA